MAEIKLTDATDTVTVALANGQTLTINGDGLIIPNVLDTPVVKVNIDGQRHVQVDGEMATVSLYGSERAPIVGLFEGPNADEPNAEWFIGD